MFPHIVLLTHVINNVHNLLLNVISFIADTECVDFRVVWKKNSYDVTFPLDEKAIKLKEHVETLTGKQYFILRILYLLEAWSFLDRNTASNDEAYV